MVRDFEDTDLEPRVLEQFPNVNLDPTSDSYIAKVIGDTKVFYNHDVVDPEDRRLIKEGTNPNRSNYVRVVMDPQVERQMVPATVLPFGFRGPSFLNTNTVLNRTLFQQVVFLVL
ncbi:MAG: hypothetical protein HC899_39240 [Leptolyngbyaceae cyanobacterium SM1_4_3]|nr:hypothetical protein [Leptolyngbyaceae cyanobacterium SM1_4_3]